MAPFEARRMTIRTRTIPAILFLVLSSGCAIGPSKWPSPFTAGPEVQVHAEGVIPSVRAEMRLSPRETITGRVGYAFVDRGDRGRHDDEKGGGPGGGVGYRYYFGRDLDGWILGGRFDVWWMTIDWEEGSGVDRRKGDTDVVVLVPAIEGGYRFRLSDSIALDLTLSAGVEMNAKTWGEDVGDGGVVLFGATLVFGP
jgi:hypothetical protein